MNVDTETYMSDIDPDEDTLDLDEPSSKALINIPKCDRLDLLNGTGKLVPYKSISLRRDGDVKMSPNDSMSSLQITNNSLDTLEAKLPDMDTFFRELNGKANLGDPSDFFSNYLTNKESVVIGLLGKSVNKLTPGIIPKAILNYNWLNDHPECKLTFGLF